MIGGEVRIAPHHRRSLPATKLLKDVQRRPVMHVPRRPGVAQILPAEALDTGALERVVPGSCADLPHRIAVVGEHVQRVLPLLPGDDLERRLVERHRNRLPGFRLVRWTQACLRGRST